MIAFCNTIQVQGRSKRVLSISVFLASALMGCVPYQWFDRVGYFNMAPRLAYQGFSFDRPPNPRWYMRQSEESHTNVLLRRDLADPTKTHSFYAEVGLRSIEKQPETHAEFAELARVPPEKADYEVEHVAYEQQLTTRQNQWCIRFDSSDLVRGAPSAPKAELTMKVGGYRCLHPAWPKVTLDFYYSERGLPTELSPELADEGETFLNGVRIDIAPDTPAS